MQYEHGLFAAHDDLDDDIHNYVSNQHLNNLFHNPGTSIRVGILIY